MSAQVARTNWARTITFSAAAFHRPESVAELQTLVAGSSRVRALGTGHSFSDIADTTGDLVSLAGLEPQIVVGEDSTVTVTAGLTYGAVGLELARHGLGLANTGSLPHIAVAGACATGTHGSGNKLRNLASAVTAVEYVSASGDLVTSRRGDPGFEGTVLSLGAIGIFTSLTLETVPSYVVRQDVFDHVPQDVVIERLPEIMASGDSVSVFSTWQRPFTSHLWRKRITTADDSGPAEQWLGTPADGPRSPQGPGHPADNVTQQLGQPGPWHERMFHFRHDFAPSFGEEVQSEYLLPIEAGRDAVRALAEIGDQLAPQVLVTELRTVAADELWLSPSYGRDSFVVHFTWSNRLDQVMPLIRLVEDRLLPLGARPHWAKLTAVTGEQLEPLYPRLDDFRDLLQRCDPTGKFRNAWLDRLIR